MIKKEYIILLIIFTSVFSLRLYFSYQTPYFDIGAYFNIRQIGSIKDTFKPIFYDKLSYSGRFLLFQPLFHYLIGLSSILIGVESACKIIPNLLASSTVIVSYFIILELTKRKNAALLTSFIIGFIPIFFAETLISVSEYSLFIPLTLLIIYSFIILESRNPKSVIIFLVSIIAASLVHHISFIIIIAFIFYIIILWAENIPRSREEIELIIFSTLLTLWVNFLLFKNAFLMHGPALIWQNIPREIMSQYFNDFNIFQAIYYIGVIPLITGIYLAFDYTYKKKNKNVYLIFSFVFSSILMLWFKLIPFKNGLMLLGIFITLLFGRFYSDFIDFINKTRIANYKTIIIAGILIIFVFNSVIPSLIYAQNIINKTPYDAEVHALGWLKNNSREDEVVLATVKEGFLVEAIANRKTVVDNNFILIKDINKRMEDIKTIYTTKYETDAISLLNKYNVRYIVVSRYAKNRYNITDLYYSTDSKCFERIYYNESIKIYKLYCHMEEQS